MSERATCRAPHPFAIPTAKAKGEHKTEFVAKFVRRLVAIAMAGIVARITKANWERRTNQRRQISSEKSNLHLPPFDRAFDPSKHNKYMSRRMARLAANGEGQEEHQRITIANQPEEAAIAKPQQKPLKTKEEEAVEATRRRELEASRARERWKADWIKAVMGATVILVPTIILVFFFVTFSLVEPEEKKVGSEAAAQYTER